MTDIDQILDIKHHFGGGVYAKQALIKAGDYAEQHVHEFDHLSVLASGRVLLEVDGESQEISGPQCLLIAAGKRHKVTALEDACWFCIHATDETDHHVIDDVILKKSEGN